ncbi:MAG: dihydrofolate reductase [Cytophagales bacterium]|nr:dihydrofolate reductase [Cytophagales bacterium]
MTISIIAAVAQNNVIGKDNKLMWHLPADLKHFKEITMGHHIIMGRKTFEAIGKALPDRTSIIITRQKGLLATDCLVVNSLEEAIKLAKMNNENEAFIIGGGEIYKLAMNIANKIYLTRIGESFEGDTFFPVINKKKWEETARKEFSADEKNRYNYAFVELEKKVTESGTKKGLSWDDFWEYFLSHFED